MTADADLAIVGSGFGGAILAMIARRLGLRVVLVERGRHPRFAIGESASPLAGILIEQLADRYDLPRLRPLSAYGTWQRAYPHIGCGLKRGFTYFKQVAGMRYLAGHDRSAQLLVAASPTDELSDTHWVRADVDHLLVNEAIALGTDYMDETSLDTIERRGGRTFLGGDRHGRRVRLCAPLVVDASGPGGFLGRAIGIPRTGFRQYPGTQALFSHFAGVARCADLPEYADPDIPPYPVDDAALHHIFGGGWMWVLRFGNGITSAGVAVTDALAGELRLADGEAAWHRLLARYPSVRGQFADATPIREFTWMPRLASRAHVAVGDGWAMLPSAAAFIDPLFSTGIPMTLLGIERMAQMLASDSASPIRMSEYSDEILAEADHAAAFIAGCYAAFPRFETFAAYSMFYFAAASFSEMARRVDAPGRPRRFLASDHEDFGPATLRLAPTHGMSDAGYERKVAAAVECLNIAGLCDPSRRNWYGIDPEETIRGASKLGVPPWAVREAIATCS